MVKNRNINSYESMAKDRLLRIINNNNNNNKRDRKSLFKSQKEETKKSLCKLTRNSPYKLKKKKLRKV